MPLPIGEFKMARRVSPESEIMLGLFNFVKNIVTTALGIVLGGYLILQIAEYRAKEMLTKFQEQVQHAAPRNLQPPRK